MNAQSFIANGRIDRSERIGSAAVGGTVALAGAALLGFTRHIGTAVALIAVGAALIGRGAGGVCAVKALLHRVVKDEPIENVDSDSMDSFPASDAPSRHSYN